MTRKLQQLDLLTRFRQLAENRHKQELTELVHRRDKLDAELQAMTQRLDSLAEKQHLLQAVGKELDVFRYEQLLAASDLTAQDLRSCALKMENIERMQHAKTVDLTDAWRERRAATERHDRELAMEARSNAGKMMIEQLTPWMLGTKEK